RIKRAIHIKISSIRYLTEKEIAKLKRIQLLVFYIEERQQEIDEYNARTNADQTVFVNGRRMTNVGLFRAYVTRYAEQHPDIHKGMTLMVRHLAPNEHGLPLELYMFTNNTDWAYFENVMANIFDHLFAAIKYFDLVVFDLPSSDDLRLYLKTVGQEKLESEMTSIGRSAAASRILILRYGKAAQQNFTTLRRSNRLKQKRLPDSNLFLICENKFCLSVFRNRPKH